ncbi:unnamed protein product, partial [marine sediment metagenome]
MREPQNMTNSLERSWGMKVLVIPALVLAHGIGLSSSGLAGDDPPPRNIRSGNAIAVEVDPRVELI